MKRLPEVVNEIVECWWFITGHLGETGRVLEFSYNIEKVSIVLTFSCSILVFPPYTI